MKRRLIFVFAILLTLLFGIQVSAARYVANIGGKSYTSMQEALNKIKTGQTLTVLDDISTKITVRIPGKDIDINFAGNEYKYDGKGNAFEISGGNVSIRNMNIQSHNYSFYVNKGAALTLSNGSSKGYLLNKGELIIDGGTYNSKGCIASKKDELIQNYGSLTINKGNFTGITDNALICNGGETEINGGSFRCNAKERKENVFFPVVLVEKKAELIINKGSFKGKGESIFSKGQITLQGGSYISYKSCAIYNYKGIALLYGGTYSTNSKKYCTVFNEQGKMTIYDADIEGTTGNLSSGKMSLIIKGGAFHSKNSFGIINKKGKTIISGGTVITKNTNAICNEEKGIIKISGGYFKSNKRYYALWNKGKAELTGGSFITTGGKYSIGCVSGSTLKKGNNVKGTVDYK